MPATTLVTLTTTTSNRVILFNNAKLKNFIVQLEFPKVLAGYVNFNNFRMLYTIHRT